MVSRAADALPGVDQTGVVDRDDGWLLRAAASVEGLDGAPLDPALVRQFERTSGSLAGRPLECHLPGFKSYRTVDLAGPTESTWPALSVTGGDCRLRCDHCRGRILEPMLPTRRPEDFLREAERCVRAGARGLLVTGGSDRQNRIDYRPFHTAFRRIKARYPELVLALHTGLIEPDAARGLAEAGVDVAMMDLIGDQDTVEQVYHLRQPVEAFERSLEALAGTGMKVVPHIVLGLHYGAFRGEAEALRMLSQHPVDAAVLVVAMPQYASRRRPFRIPDPLEVGRFFAKARQELARLPLYLGCARPAGPAKAGVDAYAVMAGFDGIAYPAEGIAELARHLGRPLRIVEGCCGTGEWLPSRTDAAGAGAA